MVVLHLAVTHGVMLYMVALINQEDTGHRGCGPNPINEYYNNSSSALSTIVSQFPELLISNFF